MDHYIAHEPYSNTLRLFPENYMIAVQFGGRWYLDADNAISDSFVSRLAVSIRACQYNPIELLVGKLNVDLSQFGSDNVPIVKVEERQNDEEATSAIDFQ